MHLLVDYFFKILFIFFNFIYLFIFRERGREGEREGEKHQCVVASRALPTGGLAHNPGMCPDWESNQRPFGSQAGTQPTEPHQPGKILIIFRERGREGERKGERHQCVRKTSITSSMTPTGHLAHKLVDSCMGPVWGSILQPWQMRDNALSN